MKKSPIPIRIISLIFLLVWMGLIFYLSHQNATVSSNTSGSIIKTAVEVVMPQADELTVEKIVADLQFWVRKSAHFLAYAILGVLFFAHLSTYSLKLFARFSISLGLCAAYSVSDEYHQTFIEGRSGEVRDFLIDTSGALLGILFSLLICLVYRKIKNRKGSKMGKKHYIELAEQLTGRLNSEKKLTKELKEHNADLETEIEGLNNRLSELLERLTAMENALNAPDTEAVAEEPLQATVTEPEPEKPQAVEPDLPEDISFGAKIIGKIVLSAAKYCNTLTAVEQTPEIKELVNLILGRAEVAKSEILRLTAISADSAQKRTAMENELNSAEDYFQSVMAQKN